MGRLMWKVVVFFGGEQAGTGEEVLHLQILECTPSHHKPPLDCMVMHIKLADELDIRLYCRSMNTNYQHNFTKVSRHILLGVGFTTAVGFISGQ